MLDLNNSEKLFLIREHAAALNHQYDDGSQHIKASIIKTAQRIIAIAESLQENVIHVLTDAP